MQARRCIVSRSDRLTLWGTLRGNTNQLGIFLTGATGFIGSQILPQLSEAAHQVLALSRSDTGAKQLAAAGAGFRWARLCWPDPCPLHRLYGEHQAARRRKW